MSEKLKPCPFCGGEALLWEIKDCDCYRVFCTKCPCCMGINLEKDEAIEAWNRRVDDE